MLDPESFQLLKSSVQKYVTQRLMPLEDQVEESNEVPDEVVQEMREMGLFGLSVPEEYGGAGLSMAQECELVMEFAQTAIAFRSCFATNVGIGSQGIFIDGTAAQKQRFLPLIASGELVVSFALTEPDTGSDAAAIRTRAEPVEGGYRVNGSKRFITNAPRAGAFTLMARTGGPGADGISAFIVPADSPGISLGPTDHKMGQRGTKTCDVNFTDVFVPSAHLIGEQEGRGFRTAMKVLDRGRLHTAATACGMAIRLLDESVRYARERRAFGARIGDFQLIQAMLADSQAEVYGGGLMVMDCARRYDERQGDADIKQVRMLSACVKMFCSEMAGRVADRAVQIHGGNGYMREYTVERFYRDVRLLRLYEGTTQIQQIVIGRALMAE